MKKIVRITQEKISDTKHKRQLLETELRSVHHLTTGFKLFDLDGLSLNTQGQEIQHFLNHQFDLLGSGIFEASYFSKPNGFEDNLYSTNLSIDNFDQKGKWLKHVINPPHYLYSIRCWELITIVQPNYKPIDWQRDYKSGFRWDAKKWFKSQGKLSANKKGVDIKFPWELSRLQHIPRLALSAKLEEKQSQTHIYQEVICQLLDFVMSNPIGMGVNFNCPMDIGIRNANILISLDIVKQTTESHQLTTELESIICNYVAASTTHILQNLEYREGLTSNHYLGNIMGVLYAGAYLSNHPNADRWLMFGMQEIETCMKRQFFNDGTNFEGSTSYHRLSAEMMVWAAGLVMSLPKLRIEKLTDVDVSKWSYNAPLMPYDVRSPKNTPYVFSEQFWTKLIKSAQFSIDITNNKGEVAQFGDNDSGRFMKLSLIGSSLNKDVALSQYLNLSPKIVPDSEAYFDENHLEHSGFVSAINGLLGGTPLPQHSDNVEIEIFNTIGCSQPNFRQFLNSLDVSVTPTSLDEIEHLNTKHHKSRSFDFNNIEVDFSAHVNSIVYPDFSMIILSNKDFHLTLAGICNPNQHHSLGHSHNDKLSIELEVNGDNILFNPGTYVYTANPEKRYQFRSVKSHNTVSVNGREQNTPLSGKFGLFNLKNETSFNLIKLSKTEIFAQVKYRNVVHQRQVLIEKKRITIHDWCNHKFEQHWNTGKPYSNGYGKRLA